MITVSAFRWVPPFAQEFVRDLRVRWALEEAGLPYKAQLLGLGEHKADAYRTHQPFGQVPAYEEDGLEIFESGAIVLHIAERSDVLLPSDEKGRARAKTWMFAALNSIEPPIMFLNFMEMQKDGASQPEYARVMDWVKMRLDELTKRLAGRTYLEDRFTAGDLLMSTVLRILRTTDLVSGNPVLDRYRKRCEARPAFEKALAAQIAPFAENAPPNA